SCTVTAAAEADLRQSIRQAARRNTALRTVVTGCAAATDQGDIRALPSVTNVIAGANLEAVALALDLPRESASIVATHQTGARALLRIQDGCDEHCTFCLTTIARGANRSRPIPDILHEARHLAEHHHEIVITGIHIGTYGADIGTSLSVLLQCLIETIPDVRFRLSSVEATELDETLHRLFADPRRLVPYLHAPLQSASNRVLKRMGRHWYTAESYADAITTLVSTRRTFGLSADVIAGFPGETESDHEATLAFIDRLPFTALHVFPFSLRPGTPAAHLPNPVPSATITRRAEELRALAHTKSTSYRHHRTGTQADIVTLGSGSHRSGLTEDYLTIPVDPTLPRGMRFTGIVPEVAVGRDLG
ncbi:MAG TPA: MiaB/RimO family radical SAM methylthiotransferase, partial [Gemmatimonadaceae bacterium]|nr:MiaB/RimO family radical SAM methylthiotransferase [Gemmatimonadaceae bacterium]